MKKSCKKIAAFTLSLAFIAGNTANFLQSNNALTAKASESVSEVQEDDKTNSNEMDWGIVLPYDDDESNQDIILPDDGDNDDMDWGIVLPYDDDGSIQDNTQDVQIKDESYYDAETRTLHLKGYVRNSEDGSGIILPEGVERKKIKTMVAEEGTVLPANCSHFCEGMDSLWEIELQNADTSNVIDMSYMFYFPKNDSDRLFDHVVLSNFDTSKVTNMQGMFKNCIAPKYDIFSFDTSNVTNMSEMFAGCGYLGYHSFYYDCMSDLGINIGSFDTSNVTNMSEMFADSDFIAINLTNFNTSKVTDMSGMFRGTWKLKQLDISTFDTSNVTDMSNMFGSRWYHGSGIEELDLSNFNTSKVTNMSGMFEYCELRSIDLSSFDTGNVTDMSSMFYGSRAVNIDLSSFDTSNVTDMSELFYECYNLTSLDLSSFDTSNVTYMNRMFNSCYALQTIIVGPNWSTESAEGVSMFNSCYNLTGGAGTVYDEDHIGIEYAHVDGGKKDPGYFTASDSNDNTIVIYVPEDVVDVITFLYDGIENPVVKDVISAAKEIISKYISIKVF